jgi:hypothetical protein
MQKGSLEWSMSTRPQNTRFDIDAESVSTNVESLLHELDTVGRPEMTMDEDTDDVTAALTAALQTLFGDEEFAFDEAMVKANLESILVTLVALQEQGTHGKALMGDLARLFDAQLSPGTVYPSLHELEDQEVFRMHEMVRTKEYRLDDEDAARELVAEAMYQHLALGLFFQQALRRM